jgi:hypothetical protein
MGTVIPVLEVPCPTAVQTFVEEQVAEGYAFNTYAHGGCGSRPA